MPSSTRSTASLDVALGAETLARRFLRSAGLLRSLLQMEEVPSLCRSQSAATTRSSGGHNMQNKRERDSNATDQERLDQTRNDVGPCAGPNVVAHVVKTLNGQGLSCSSTRVSPTCMRCLDPWQSARTPPWDGPSLDHLLKRDPKRRDELRGNSHLRRDPDRPTLDRCRVRDAASIRSQKQPSALAR